MVNSTLMVMETDQNQTIDVCLELLSPSRNLLFTQISIQAEGLLLTEYVLNHELYLNWSLAPFKVIAKLKIANSLIVATYTRTYSDVISPSLYVHSDHCVTVKLYFMAILKNNVNASYIAKPFTFVNQMRHVAKSEGYKQCRFANTTILTLS